MKRSHILFIHCILFNTQVVELTFHKFVTEYSATCTHDNLKIFDGPEEKREMQITNACGKLGNSYHPNTQWRCISNRYVLLIVQKPS